MRASQRRRPMTWRGRRLLKGLGLTALAAGAYVWGRLDVPPAAIAQEAPTVVAPAPSSDYTQRVVATIYGKIHITREDFGEYLMARTPPEKLEFLINKRIIEHECKQYNIEVSNAEIESALAEDCASINVKKEDFVANVLKQYGKSLYEWKEDVIRPRLLLGKLCHQQVQITDQDLQQMFDSLYGEKVKCRVILFSKAVQERQAFQVWEKVRNDPQEFDKQARHQENGYLAARGGEIQPIGHYAAEDEDSEKLEKAAFSLEDGEVGPLLKLKNGYFIIRREGLQAPEKDKSLDKEREALAKMVLDRKVKKMIPIVFEDMKKRANASNYLQPQETDAKLKSDVNETIKKTSLITGPTGN
jgi:hypothetical protein